MDRLSFSKSVQIVEELNHVETYAENEGCTNTSECGSNSGGCTNTGVCNS